MKIILTGSMAIDQIMTFDGHFKDQIQPDKLHVLSISVLVKSLRRTDGGVAGNIAYTLGLLGEKPLLLVSIGSEGKAYIKKLTKLGVDTSQVHFSQLPTATFSVLTDRDNCQVGGFYPGAMDDGDDLTLRSVADDDSLVVISPNSPKYMVGYIKQCARLKKRIFFDLGQQILALTKADLIAGLKVSQILIVNDYEFGMILTKTGLTKSQVLKNLHVCVITYGADGVEVYERSHQYQPVKIKAVQVENPVDPTGAGDAFRAGFLYGYVRAWSAEDCARLGCTVAAYAVETIGTQEFEFTWPQLQKRYMKTYQKVLKHNSSSSH